MREPGTVPARQRGWAGVLTLLLAVLFVALAAGVLLRQYGAPAAAARRAEPDPRAAGATGPGSAARAEVESPVPAPGNAVERARALEESVRQQASDLDKRIDDAAR